MSEQETGADAVESNSDTVTLEALASVATLRAITCRAISAVVRDPSVAEVDVPSGMSARLASLRKAGTLTYRFEYAMDLTDSSGSGRVAASATCTYEALYELPQNTSTDEWSIGLFGKTEVARILHPYAGEALASMFLRVGCPIPPIGPMRGLPRTLDDNQGCDENETVSK